MENKEYRLPKDFAEKWLKALRSGKYKQCDGKLYKEEESGFCCLGVACEFSGVNPYEIDGVGWIYDYVAVKSENKIPDELVGSDFNNRLVCVLSEMNDSGRSFAEIADWIEENVELY